MLVLIVMLMASMPEISMDRLDLHQDTKLTLFKTPKGYLLNSGKENKAILFSPDGQILGRYDRQGHGPNEFHNQFILKIDGDGIYFCSNGRFVMGFNHDLKPKETSLPNLPINHALNSSFGLMWGKDSVLVSLAGRDHLFLEFQQKRDHWNLTQEHVPTHTDPSYDSRQYLATGKRPLVHHQTLFSSRVAVAADEAGYDIEVFSDFVVGDAEGELNTVLTADVDGFPTFVGMRALIYSVAKTPQGYVVEIFSHLKKGGSHKRWHDHFNHHGQLMKRVAMDGKKLLPVLNSDETFLIEESDDDWVLKRVY